MDKFIERAIRYPLEHGLLTIYESNIPSKDIKFHFEKHVLTIMEKGHKSIMANGVQYEFFPGTVLIPQKDIIQSVSIANATFDNPTKCIEIDFDSDFIKKYYDEILHSEKDKVIINTNNPDNAFYLSNDKMIIDLIIRIYKRRLLKDNRGNQMIITLMLKELLLIIFQTNGRALLLQNLEETIKDLDIKRSIEYIKHNFNQKLNIDTLAEISGLGNTTFFKKFKKETHLSPMDYVLNTRLEHAKVLMKKNENTLKEIAFKSGFNSYEYFCIAFKKIENMKPSEFKKQIQ